MEVTQVKYPIRAVVRTVLAAAVGLLPVLPAIADGLGVSAVPWVAATLAVSGAITKILAHPSTEQFLQHHAPWLSATPPDKDTRQ
ncbi:hypothetical protein ACL1HR_08420 [Corynebacterium striatum]|uniref:hypothetical protein n=1 Tax=Corynebacterium striatum TaxID=43770 RepID=UPI00191E0A73|nr:hypothetical protein [Corynebacterium striatum]EGT5591766.1 hypothetical protein [Corynebacterium striatum]QQU79119.1 hypothetical protein I6I73_10260 [Corynebacterium striatum]